MLKETPSRPTSCGAGLSNSPTRPARGLRRGGEPAMPAQGAGISAAFNMNWASARPRQTCSVSNGLLPIRPAGTLNVDLAGIDPLAHQVEATELDHAGQGCHLLQRLLIRLQICVRPQKSAELRIDQHDRAAAVMHQLGACGQRLEEFIGRQLTHRLDCDPSATAPGHSDATPALCASCPAYRLPSGHGRHARSR